MTPKNKVAIMTWYSYKNFGTALQVSALANRIDNFGYESAVIAYPPKGGPTDPTPKGVIKRFALKVLKRLGSDRIYASNERDELFNSFLKERIRQTPECRSYSELHDLNGQFDAFVCGSDQVWSWLCYDDKYFLTFVDEPQKMIAYAPSMSQAKIKNKIIREKIAAHVKRFNNLSVRELQGAELIKSLTNQTAKVCLDPTLLLSANEWSAFAGIASAPKINKKKYILCYFLGKKSRYMRYVRALSLSLRMPYYIIPITNKDARCKNRVEFEVGPKEFVSLAANASFICTDSFHGAAFAINYNVPFSVFKRFNDNDEKNQNSRILSLLKLLKLEECLIDPLNYSTYFERELGRSFDNANLLLKNLRKSSLNYLKSALAKAVFCPMAADKAFSYKITDMCTGCGACMAVCKANAISILLDAEGFLHCKIDKERCVKCGLCKTVCPTTGISAQEISASVGLFAIKSNSSSALKKSSSGAAGFEIAKKLQGEGYVVCGCSYNRASNAAEHIIIRPSEPDKLAQIQGSKYIQSASANAIKQISGMNAQEKLLFFGTPCQAAAVDKLLRLQKRRNQAVLVDLICHGVPSYFLWQKYLTEQNKNYHTGANPKVFFRSKQNGGWRRRRLRLEGENGLYERSEASDDFYAFFRRGLCYMKACTDCPYREKSAADIRMGDYWGSRYKSDDTGVSMVIACTQTSSEVIAKLCEACRIEKNDLSEYFKVQFPYNQPRPLCREQLIAELKSSETGLHALRKKYCTWYDLLEAASKLKAFLASCLAFAR